MKSLWTRLWSWTHYLLLTLQFYRSLMISISRITVMNSVGKDIIQRKYWRQIRTITLWLQNKLLLGCHVTRRLFVVWTKCTTSFFFIELLPEEISTHTVASLYWEKSAATKVKRQNKATLILLWLYAIYSPIAQHTCLYYLLCQSPCTITWVKHNVFAGLEFKGFHMG